jgi:hypothetical protein
VKHTIRNVTFEVPEGLTDFSDYTYESADGTMAVAVQSADDQPPDAPALVESARVRYVGVFGPLIIYTAPAGLAAGDGSAVAAVEGEQRDANDRSKRSRFAIAAVVSKRTNAVLLYSGPSGADSLKTFARIIGSLHSLGDPPPPRSLPAEWTRHQARQLVLGFPAGWTSPSTLVFRSGIELRVTVAEPLTPEGNIELASEWPGVPLRVLRAKTEPIAEPTKRGWKGRWLVSVEGAKPFEAVLHKASVSLPAGAVTTVYAKGPNAASDRVQRAADTVEATVQASEGLR